MFVWSLKVIEEGRGGGIQRNIIINISLTTISFGIWVGRTTDSMQYIFDNKINQNTLIILIKDLKFINV